MTLFISHSTQDKQTIALPLYQELLALNLDPWIDQEGIEPSDSLFQKINQAIAKSHYGVAIVSPAFIASEWTNRELQVLDNLRLEKRIKRLFLIYHEITREKVLCYYPLLSDDLALNSSEPIATLAQKIAEVIESKSKLERFVELKRENRAIDTQEFIEKLPDIQGAFYLLLNLQVDSDRAIKNSNRFLEGLIDRLEIEEKKILFGLLARDLMASSREYQEMFDEILSRFERRNGTQTIVIEPTMLESSFLSTTLHRVLES
ncbi:MAG: hypothetical protein KU38_11700 [Sulfurovum sp. FS08-3]|nr:MAG: hypothetical protein KU38_11700 [Sulfurovum sp. FS08-3]